MSEKTEEKSYLGPFALEKNSSIMIKPRGVQCPLYKIRVSAILIIRWWHKRRRREKVSVWVFSWLTTWFVQSKVYSRIPRSPKLSPTSGLTWRIFVSQFRLYPTLSQIAKGRATDVKLLFFPPFFLGAWDSIFTRQSVGSGIYRARNGSRVSHHSLRRYVDVVRTVLRSNWNKTWSTSLRNKFLITCFSQWTHKFTYRELLSPVSVNSTACLALNWRKREHFTCRANHSSHPFLPPSGEPKQSVPHQRWTWWSGSVVHAFRPA